MERARFDALAKGVGRAASRRSMLRVVGAATVGGALGGLRQRVGMATPSCPPGYKLCNGRNGKLCYAPPQVCCHGHGGDNVIGATADHCAPPSHPGPGGPPGQCTSQPGGPCTQDSDCCCDGTPPDCETGFCQCCVGC